MASVSL